MENSSKWQYTTNAIQNRPNHCIYLTILKIETYIYWDSAGVGQESSDALEGY